MSGDTLVSRKSDFFHSFAGFRIVQCRHPEKEFLFFLIKKDDHRPSYIEKNLHFFCDEFQKLIQTSKAMQFFRDPEKSQITLFYPLFMCDVAEGEHQTRRSISLFIKNSPVK